MLIMFDDLPKKKKVTKEELEHDWYLEPKRAKKVLDKMYNGELCKAATVHDRKAGTYRPCSCNKLPGEELCGHHLLMQRKAIEFVDCPALSEVKGFIGFKRDICKAICKYWMDGCKYAKG